MVLQKTQAITNNRYLSRQVDITALKSAFWERVQKKGAYNKVVQVTK